MASLFGPLQLSTSTDRNRRVSAMPSKAPLRRRDLDPKTDALGRCCETDQAIYLRRQLIVPASETIAVSDHEAAVKDKHTDEVNRNIGVSRDEVMANLWSLLQAKQRLTAQPMDMSVRRGKEKLSLNDISLISDDICKLWYVEADREAASIERKDATVLQRDELVEQLKVAQHERDSAINARNAIQQQHDSMVREKDRCCEESKTFKSERDEYRVEKEQYHQLWLDEKAERNHTDREVVPSKNLKVIEQERNGFIVQADRYRRERNSARENRDSLRTEWQQCQNQNRILEEELKAVRNKLNSSEIQTQKHISLYNNALSAEVAAKTELNLSQIESNELLTKVRKLDRKLDSVKMKLTMSDKRIEDVRSTMGNKLDRAQSQICSHESSTAKRVEQLQAQVIKLDQERQASIHEIAAMKSTNSTLAIDLKSAQDVLVIRRDQREKVERQLRMDTQKTYTAKLFMERMKLTSRHESTIRELSNGWEQEKRRLVQGWEQDKTQLEQDMTQLITDKTQLVRDWKQEKAQLEQDKVQLVHGWEQDKEHKSQLVRAWVQDKTQLVQDWKQDKAQLVRRWEQDKAQLVQGQEQDKARLAASATTDRINMELSYSSLRNLHRKSTARNQEMIRDLVTAIAISQSSYDKLSFAYGRKYGFVHDLTSQVQSLEQQLTGIQDDFAAQTSDSSRLQMELCGKQEELGKLNAENEANIKALDELRLIHTACEYDKRLQLGRTNKDTFFDDFSEFVGSLPDKGTIFKGQESGRDIEVCFCILPDINEALCLFRRLDGTFIIWYGKLEDCSCYTLDWQIWVCLGREDQGMPVHIRAAYTSESNAWLKRNLLMRAARQTEVDRFRQTELIIIED